MNPEILEKAQLAFLSAVVKALIQTHPEPGELQKAWRESAAAVTARWSQDAVGIGQPGFGEEELKEAHRQMSHSISTRVK